MYFIEIVLQCAEGMSSLAASALSRNVEQITHSDSKCGPYLPIDPGKRYETSVSGYFH
jgi:hypothetical protein